MQGVEKNHVTLKPFFFFFFFFVNIGFDDILLCNDRSSKYAKDCTMFSSHFCVGVVEDELRMFIYSTLFN